MRIKILKVQKWLPRYLSDFFAAFNAHFEHLEYDSFGAMAKSVSSYIEDYRVNHALLLGHKQSAVVDYSTRIRYTVETNRIIIHNITGRVNMLKITLAEI